MSRRPRRLSGALPCSRLVPGKLVFTVKPPAEPSRGVSGAPRWKRKARLVICGNFIDPDSGMNLFATGASAESRRVALCLASKACGLLDVRT